MVRNTMFLTLVLHLHFGDVLFDTIMGSHSHGAVSANLLEV